MQWLCTLWYYRWFVGLREQTILIRDKRLIFEGLKSLRKNLIFEFFIKRAQKKRFLHSPLNIWCLPILLYRRSRAGRAFVSIPSDIDVTPVIFPLQTRYSRQTCQSNVIKILQSKVIQSIKSDQTYNNQTTINETKRPRSAYASTTMHNRWTNILFQHTSLSDAL